MATGSGKKAVATTQHQLPVGTETVPLGHQVSDLLIFQKELQVEITT